MFNEEKSCRSNQKFKKGVVSIQQESLKGNNDEYAKESEGIIAKLQENIGRVKEQKEKEICDLRKAIEHHDKKILSLEEIMSKDGTKINELNIQLREQQNHLLNKAKEKDEVEQNLKFVETKLQILSSNEKDILEEMGKLRRERDELKEEVEKNKSEAEKHEEAMSNLKEQLEAQLGHVEVKNFYYNIPFLFVVLSNVSLSGMLKNCVICKSCRN